MRYILKKLFIFLLTLFATSLLVFFAFEIIAGDPTTKILGIHATPEKIAELRAVLGLDRPMLLRYFTWLGGFVTGDLGMSFSYVMPVGELLVEKIRITAALSTMSFFIVIAIAFPVSIILARYAHTVFDRTIMVLNQLLMSMPPFFIGIIFSGVFGLIFKFFTPGEFIPYSVNPAGFWGFLFFPALAIALPKSAMVIKLFRGSMVRELGEDYVRTAFSRGNSRWRALMTHVLRNAIIPVVTFLAFTLVDIIAGSIIIERVFAIHGMGSLLLSSINDRDLPVVQTIVMIIATVVITVNYLADISYKYIDPRIRFR